MYTYHKMSEYYAENLVDDMINNKWDNVNKLYDPNIFKDYSEVEIFAFKCGVHIFNKKPMFKKYINLNLLESRMEPIMKLYNDGKEDDAIILRMRTYRAESKIKDDKSYSVVIKSDLFKKVYNYVVENNKKYNNNKR